MNPGKSILRLCLLLLVAFAAAPQSALAADLPRSRWAETLQLDRVESLLNQALQKARAEPNNIDAHLRVARLGFYAWRLEKSDNRKRLQIAYKVLEAGRKAVEIDPGHPGGWHWLGCGYGFIGLTQGILNSLHLLPKVKQPMEKSAELDPAWMHGSALAQLARLYAVVPGFPVSIGNPAKGEEYARRAITLDPDYPIHRLYTADLLWYQGRTDEALAQLEAFFNVKPDSEVAWFTLEVSKPKAREMRELILKGEKRDRFYDVLSDIAPGIVN